MAKGDPSEHEHRWVIVWQDGKECRWRCTFCGAAETVYSKK